MGKKGRKKGGDLKCVYVWSSVLLLFLSFLCELLASKSNKGVNPFPESLLSKVFGIGYA